MHWTSIVIALQFLASTDTATVNFVDGRASVAVHSQVPPGGNIEAQAGGRVEALLAPGVYLRIGQNTNVVIDSLNPDIQLHLTQGSVLIDSVAQNPRTVRILTDAVKASTAIVGVYEVSSGSVTVFDGTLDIDSIGTVKKGNRVNFDGGRPNVTPFKPNREPPDSLYAWNRERTRALGSVLYRINGKVIADEEEPWTVEVQLDRTAPGGSGDCGKGGPCGFIAKKPGANIQKSETSSDGEFHFDGVALGEYWVVVIDPRFKPTRYPIALKQPQDTERRFTIPLERIDAPPSASILRIEGRELIKMGQQDGCGPNVPKEKLDAICPLLRGVRTLLQISDPEPGDRDYLAIAYFKLNDFGAAQQQLALAIDPTAQSSSPVRAEPRPSSAAAKAFFHHCEQAGSGPLESGQDAAGGGVCYEALGALQSYLTLFPSDLNRKQLEQIAAKLQGSLVKARDKSTTLSDTGIRGCSATLSNQRRATPASVGDPTPVREPPSEDSDLAAVLGRARRYIAEYEARLGNLVGEEQYLQKTSGRARLASMTPNPNLKKTQQQTESTFLILKVGKEWVGARDVTCVDGVTVKGKAQEFLKAFSSGKKDDILKRLDSIQSESALYNIGAFQRNTNVPTFPLRILRQGIENHFQFQKIEEDTLNGFHVWAIGFRETKGPTMIHDLENQDVFANGTLWVDPETGTVLRTELNVAEHNFREAFRSRSTVTYTPNPALGILLPSTMVEHSENDLGYSLDTRADYSNFRRPEADVKLDFGAVPSTRPN